MVRQADRVEPAEAFGFMSEHQAEHRIATMCRLLGVSASGYYAWLEPCGVGTIDVGCKRVTRLMRAAALAGASRRKGCWTTRRDRDARPAPDRVERKFVADGAGRLCVADITFIPTWAGCLFLAVVLDAFSRRIVGWAMANHLRTELVLEALNMAVAQRRPDDVIYHSDQGCPYTSIATDSRRRSRGGWPCSTSSRAGATRSDVTPHWTATPRSITKGGTQRRFQPRCPKTASLDARRVTTSEPYESEIGGSKASRVLHDTTR